MCNIFNEMQFSISASEMMAQFWIISASFGHFNLNHLLLRLISTLLKLEILTLLTLEISSFRRVEISKQTNEKADDSN